MLSFLSFTYRSFPNCTNLRGLSFLTLRPALGQFLGNQNGRFCELGNRAKKPTVPIQETSRPRSFPTRTTAANQSQKPHTALCPLQFPRITKPFGATHLPNLGNQSAYTNSQFGKPISLHQQPIWETRPTTHCRADLGNRAMLHPLANLGNQHHANPRNQPRQHCPPCSLPNYLSPTTAVPSRLPNAITPQTFPHLSAVTFHLTHALPPCPIPLKV